MVIGTPTVLNLIPGGVMKVIHVNQVNENIEIQFRIMNGAQPFNVPEGVSCTIRGTKGDNFGYAADVAVTAGSNIVTVTLTEQLTAVAGAGNIFELVFVGASDDMKVSTENFLLDVERAALGEDTVISDSDLAYADQVLDQLQSVGAVNAQVQQNKANIAAEITRATAAEQTLQQNINAEAAARQAADNTLQSNINAEASSRATTDASLQSQINQLVAPSGSAPSAAEVENARIGSDGTVYPTLGDAIRTQNSDLKNALNQIMPLEYVVVFENKTINISGVIYDATDRLLSPFFVAKEGETFNIGNGYEYRIVSVNQNDSISTGNWMTTETEFTAYMVATYKGFYINVRNGVNPNADITPSEVSYVTTISQFIFHAQACRQSDFENLVGVVESLEVNNFSLNNVLTDKQNMIWSWWYYPQVISFNRIRNKLYWGYTAHDGYTGIAEYDFDTGKVVKNNLKKSDVDDHNGLALYVFDEGTIICAYAGGHNTDKKMHIRISTTPECVERFDDEIVLDSSGYTSYGQFIYYNGTLYLFYRVNNNNWAYRYSSDNGKTWTNEIILITASFQYYCRFMPTTTDGVIRIVMYSNPDGGDANIRQGFMHLSNGSVYNSDNSTALGSANIPYSNFTIIIPVETGKVQRMFDVAITSVSAPLILFCTFSLNSNNDSVYKIYDSGTITTLVNGGEALWIPKYQDGCAWIGTDKIVSIRGYQGQDIVEIYDYADNAVTLSETVYSELKGNIPIRNARPIVDINEKAFLWHRGYYNTSDYTDFNTDAKMHLLTD